MSETLLIDIFNIYQQSVLADHCGHMLAMVAYFVSHQQLLLQMLKL